MESVTKINVDSYSSNKGLHHTKIETILTHWSEAGSNDENYGGRKRKISLDGSF